MGGGRRGAWGCLVLCKPDLENYWQKFWYFSQSVEIADFDKGVIKLGKILLTRMTKGAHSLAGTLFEPLPKGRID